MTWLRAVWQRLLILILWRQPPPEAVPPAPEPMPEPPPKPDIVTMLAMDIVPPPDAPPITPPVLLPTPAPMPVPVPELPPLPPIFVLPPHRREKWVTSKPALEPPSPSRTVPHRPKPWEPPKPKRERIQLTEDPEQWGQYYFRDAILDQLDLYWIYLRRMKRGDRDAYDLLHQIGIQLVPWSATHGFDRWAKDDSATIELSPWWREHRPTFGAIAYGFDDYSAMLDCTYVADVAEPGRRTDHWKSIEDRLSAAGVLGWRPIHIGPSTLKYDKQTQEKPSSIWTPRFLYFSKYDKPPPDFEHKSGGDTYRMTVYWDRADKDVPKRWRAKQHGGVPQQYGIFIEHKTGRVQVLRTKLRERVVIKWAKGPYGGKCTEPTEFINTHWEVPDRYLRWSHRDLSNIEPEDYLRRLFIQAASMYESAVLGSMVRIAVSKRDLTATFGVEIKRMSHFFKDRDVALTVKGSRRPVLHVVRPHVRKDGAEVRMHFRGMRKFDWAGYHVSVSIPGRDHLLLPEFDVGMEDSRAHSIPRSDWMYSKDVGKYLVNHIQKGTGKLQQ